MGREAVLCSPSTPLLFQRPAFGRDLTTGLRDIGEAPLVMRIDRADYDRHAVVVGCDAVAHGGHHPGLRRSESARVRSMLARRTARPALLALNSNCGGSL